MPCITAHRHTVMPRLVVADGAAAIDFYRRAFGAEELGERFIDPDGRLIHAEVKIGDSLIIVSDDAEDGAPARAPAAVGGAVTAIMATHWDEVDAVWERAVAAGAEVLYPLEDQFYGERAGRLRDPFGHQWMLSQVLEELSHQEIERRAAEYFQAG